MAETSGFFNAEMVEGDGSTTYDRIYYADQFAYYFSKFISNGVYINPATQLKVTSKGELKLNVAVGDAFINGYWYKNDENFELQLAQANGSLPRIDRVVLRWDSLTRYINLAILQGNPAATPSAKNLTRNADTWELGLADIYIERGVLSISDANVTDLRPDRTYCGYVAGVVNQIDTTNLFAQFTDAFEQYYEKQVTASDKFSSDLAKKYNDYAVLAETNFGKWMTDTKGDFDTWYETIQAMLSDEEAVKLANQISELKKQFQLLALRGLKTDLFELASNDGSVFTENAQNAYVFLKQIYGKSELVNDAFISVGESGALEFDSVDATNENVSSAKLTTGMPLRGFIIDDVAVANYTDANGKYWLCDSIELSVDGYWYCIKRVGSILPYNSESVGSIYKTPTGTLDKGKQVLYKLSDYVVSKLTDEEQSQLSELLSYGGGKLPVTTGSNAAEAIQLHVEQNVTDENGVHNIRFRNGSLQYKEGSGWKDAKQYSMNVDFSTSTSKSLNDSIEAHLVLSNATRNLLNPTMAAFTKNGITCTNNGDGTYTLNGTATDKIDIDLTNSLNIVNGKEYLLCFPSPSISVRMYIMNGQNSVEAYGNHPTTFKYIGETTTNKIVHLDIGKGYTCNNLIIKPMVTTDVSATYDDFVPYSGYDIKTIGKNILKYPYMMSSVNNNGVIFTVVKEGVVKISGSTEKKYMAFIISDTNLEEFLLNCLKNSHNLKVSCKTTSNKANTFLQVLTADNKFVKNFADVLPKDAYDWNVYRVKVLVQYDDIGSDINAIVSDIMVTLDDSDTTLFTPYQTSTTKITKDTEFPVTGLKSFDGVTNIISPGNVKVTYAKSESGAAILDASKNKLDKDDIANNQTTTVKGFALDARQANPNIKGSLGAQIKVINDMFNTKKIPSIAIENIFTGNPFCIVNNGSDVISVQTDWDIDNGGYRVKNIKYPAGTVTNLTVSLSLPANSIVIVDVNTLNGENIDVQGSLIRSNFTSSPEIWNLSIKFTGRTNQILSDIRYMPLVIHLG
nr:MAG TPA: Receptor Binding Protein [Caudoviricetes sp.]